MSTAIEIWAGARPAWRPRPGDLVMGAIVRDDLNATSTGPIVVVPLATAELHVQLMAIDDPTWAVSDADEQEAMEAPLPPLR